MNTEWLTASEIGDYVFCKRGWWLRRNNKLPSTTIAMEKGKAKHSSLLMLLYRSNVVGLLAKLFLTLGVLIMLAIIFTA